MKRIEKWQTKGGNVTAVVEDGRVTVSNDGYDHTAAGYKPTLYSESQWKWMCGYHMFTFLSSKNAGYSKELADQLEAAHSWAEAAESNLKEAVTAVLRAGNTSARKDLQNWLARYDEDPTVVNDVELAWVRHKAATEAFLECMHQEGQ